MSLARQFGRWDVDQFMAEIPAAQVVEWVALDRLEATERGEGHALQQALAATAGSVVRGIKG